MKERVLQQVTSLGAHVIVFDIDGTLKDLVREHKESLKGVVELVEKKTIRKKVVLSLDKVAMWFVKAGVLPTNGRMQRILMTIYATILNENKKCFNDSYMLFYDNENILFNDSKELLKDLLLDKEVYFVTINKQNYNLEEHGIIQERIIYTQAEKKKEAYRRLFDEKKLDKSKILIIGDNLFDDIKSAKKLGIECLLVDNYNSKTKRIIAKLLNVGM